MKRLRLYAVAAITVLVIAVAIFVAFNYVSSSHQQKGSLSSDSFYQEPVVDVILPALYNNGVNAPLNLTKGSSASLTVEIFPQVNLNCSVDANVSSLSNPSQNISDVISTTISPDILTIAQESSSNTTLRITASSAVQLGEYRVTVTAINLENESQYWGAIFQLNVLT